MPAQRDPYTSPSIRAFANELTANRERVILSVQELSDLLGYTRQFIGQIEACKNRPSKKFAEDCDTYFATTGVFLRLWHNISDAQDLRGLPPGFLDYAALEPEADEMRIFCAMLITGLLQTEGYARTAISHTEETNAEALTAKRMERKLVFERDETPQLFLVIDEVVLRREIGGPEVMRDQLRYLYEISHHAKVQIQVIPFRAGYHVGLGGSLTILGFHNRPSVGYVESGGVGVLVEQPSGVSSLNVRYDLLRGHALDVVESRAILKAAMEDWAMGVEQQVTWRKSTHSDHQGGECVEVAAVPMSWRKSSRSDHTGGDCVELAGGDSEVLVRDSKNPAHGHLRLSGRAFRDVVRGLREA